MTHQNNNQLSSASVRQGSAKEKQTINYLTYDDKNKKFFESNFFLQVLLTAYTVTLSKLRDDLTNGIHTDSPAKSLKELLDEITDLIVVPSENKNLNLPGYEVIENFEIEDADTIISGMKRRFYDVFQKSHEELLTLKESRRLKPEDDLMVMVCYCVDNYFTQKNIDIVLEMAKDNLINSLTANYKVNGDSWSFIVKNLDKIATDGEVDINYFINNEERPLMNDMAQTVSFMLSIHSVFAFKEAQQTQLNDQARRIPIMVSIADNIRSKIGGDIDHYYSVPIPVLTISQDKQLSRELKIQYCKDYLYDTLNVTTKEAAEIYDMIDAAFDFNLSTVTPKSETSLGQTK